MTIPHYEEKVMLAKREIKKECRYSSIETDDKRSGQQVKHVSVKMSLALKKDKHKDRRGKIHPKLRLPRDPQHHPATDTPMSSTNMDSAVFIDSLSGSVQGKSLSRKPNKGKKNRMGQRGRQRLWDDIYGTKAKHYTKKKVPAKFKQGEVQGRRGKRKHAESSLHPSWEASKKKKELESKIVEFQGQRTTFSDSD